MKLQLTLSGCGRPGPHSTTRVGKGDWLRAESIGKPRETVPHGACPLFRRATIKLVGPSAERGQAPSLIGTSDAGRRRSFGLEPVPFLPTPSSAPPEYYDSHPPISAYPKKMGRPQDGPVVNISHHVFGNHHHHRDDDDVVQTIRRMPTRTTRARQVPVRPQHLADPQ